jgi:hypothetical protein
VGAEVLTVSVALVPGATELGLTEHIGAASDGVGFTAQVKVTEPLNPLNAVTDNVEEDDAPGLIVPGVSAEDPESEKPALSHVVVETAIPLPLQSVVPLEVADSPWGHTLESRLQEKVALTATQVPVSAPFVIAQNAVGC